MPALTRLLSALLTATLIGACSAASSPGQEASLEPSTTEADLASQSGVCGPGLVCAGALVPGDYTSTSAGPTITFTLDGTGWSGSDDLQGEGFSLSNEAVGGKHGIAVVAYDGEVFADVCSGGPKEMIGAAPADLIAFLAGVEGVQAEEPVDTTVGGQPAIRLELTTVSPCPDDRMWLWTFPNNRDFHFNGAERVRVYAVDGGGWSVIIVIEAFLDADYDVLLQKAEEVIATMAFAPA